MSLVMAISYLIFSIICMVVVAIRFLQEKIRKHYYLLRFPEEIIKVVMHYPNNMYKVFYRLIPKDRRFKLEKGKYYFDEKLVNKNSEVFIKKEKDKNIITIDGKNYNYEKINKINTRWDDIPEIHYHLNNPAPIDFSTSTGGKTNIKYNAKELDEVVDSSTVSKLLNLDEQNKMLMLLFIFILINLVVSIFTTLVVTGVIKIHGGA